LRKAKDWNQPCPNPVCDQYQRMNPGNISAIATYATQSGTRRIFKCRDCGGTFSETRDTVFFDLRTAEEKVMMALKMLLVRVELAAISFVLGVTEETLIEWLRRAALKAEAINAHLLREVHLTHIQLDELWNFIARQCSHASDAQGESLAESDDGRQWIWLSYAPEYRLIVAAFVGPRTFESALHLIRMTAAVVAGIPAFFSDCLSMYLPALVAVYHRLKVFPRTGKPGRPRKPLLEPDPELVYAQVIKQKRKGRLTVLGERVVLGAEKLARLGVNISTSLIERLNQTFRHALSPLVRKSRSFCKTRTQMRRRVVFFQTFYNFARPHMSLRTAIPLHERVSRGMIQPRWRQCTPAMAAGLTNHVWTFRELLTAKFEPVHYQSISG
jgi:IS1 family transposase/transposase-like protein